MTLAPTAHPKTVFSKYLARQSSSSGASDSGANHPTQLSSTAQERRALIGQHSTKSEGSVRILLLSESAPNNSTEYTWWEMDDYCGQVNEFSSGSWDIFQGALQLTPTGKIPSTLGSTRILTLDGELTLVTRRGSWRMEHDPSYRPQEGD